MKRRIPALVLLAALSAPALSLDLATTLGRSVETAEARAALALAEYAEAQYREAAYPGDLRLSLDPALKRSADDILGEAKSSTLDLGLSLSTPLGLVQSAALKAEAARVQAEWAAAILEWQLAAIRLKAFSLYADAWEAQEEAALLIRELDAAEREFAASKARFEAGSLSYSEYRKAEEALLATIDDQLHSSMRARVSRLELFAWLGLADDDGVLAAPSVAPGTLPRAADLAASAQARDPDARKALAELELLERELADAYAFAPSLSARVSGAKDGFSASLAWASDTARLSAGGAYELPLEGTSLAPEPWTLTASATLTFDSGGADRRSVASIELEVLAARARLEERLASYGVEIRLAYQSWVRAADAAEQALRAEDIAREALRTMEARGATGGATETELLRAAIDADRAAYRALAGAVDAERARLAAAIAARHPAEINEVQP
ncbi:MAG: TolC family protein [Spirochaetales bacterium]|nr:TolC family protein [Spirochaetales bacterium]